MHNNIMAAGSKDRPPMLGQEEIPESSPVEAAENILPVAAHEEAETIHNMTTENKLYFQAEKEAIFLILTDSVSRTKLRRDKDMKKNWHPAKYFKNLYKPTKQQPSNFFKLRTRLRYYTKSVVQRKLGYSALTASDLALSQECRKPKACKDYAYTRKKMMIYMAKIQEVSPEEISSTSQPLEQVDQNAAECVNERAALANLIANLTLDTEENKTILKQLKKANASLTQEMEECKTNLDEV
ncbi:hypothetical protein Tco_0790178 [Tanacetum coccineum]